MEDQMIPELSPFDPTKEIKTYLKCHKKTSKTSEGGIKTDEVKTQERKESHKLTTKNAIKYLLEGTLKRMVCRYCLTVTSPLSELDQILQVAGKRAIYKVTIRDMLASFHPYKVTEDPNFPNKICEKCLRRTISSYLFTQQCEQAERALRNCFDDMYDKVEKLDPLERPKKRGRQKQQPNYNILYTEHVNVIDYAEPIINMVHTASESLTKEDDIKDFECLKCCQVLPNIESLLNHEKSHPVSMWYHCRLCGKSFPKLYSLSRHMGTHKRKKPVINKVETIFTCNRCGDVSKNHNKYLQHLEKHKFKTIMEHLVEKKMNRLCSICLEKSANMIDLDKELCLHGGYTELNGDRSLYTILGSTLPEPKSYKYQELMVANKADIVTIIKRNNNIPSTTGTLKIPNFPISLPIIISKQNIDYNCIYMYFFSEPQLINTFAEQDVSNNLELCMDDEDNAQSNCEAEEISISTQNSEQEVVSTSATVNTVVPKPSYEDNNYDVKSSDRVMETNIREDNLQICKICWPFQRAVCRECTSKVSSFEIGMENTNQMLPSETCNYCWIFKHLDKCDICKKLNMANGIVNVETPDPHNIKEPLRNDLHEPFSDLATTWQCSICLTTNNVDTQACCCCESQLALDDPFRCNLKPNIAYFEIDKKIAQHEPELEVVTSTCNNISERTNTTATYPQSNDRIDNGFQINNCFNYETESNISNMEVVTISEKFSNANTDFHLSNSKPDLAFTSFCMEQMEIDENRESNDFKACDTMLYDEAHFKACEPLQFHVGVGSKNKRKINKQIKHISWSRK